MKLISLYAGSGGLDYGFKKLNFKSIVTNDIDKDCCLTIKKFLGINPICADINNLLDKLPETDVLIGGPPCQSFSLLGKREKNDPRGKEVFNFLAAVKKTNPKALLFENVLGLSNSRINNIRLTDYIKNKLEKMGYLCTQQKFNCTEYLIPQTRVRYIIIGWKKNLKIPTIPNIRDLKKILNIDSDQDITYIFDALNDLPKPVKKGEYANYLHQPNCFFQKFARQDLKRIDKISHHFEFKMSDRDKSYVKYIKPGGNYTQIPDSISSPRIMRIKQTGGRTTTYGRLHKQKFSATVNTYFNRPNVGTNYHYSQQRLITPREAMRIQSFPDSFSPEFSNLRSLCKQIGNAVPPLLSIVLAKTIKSIFRK